LKADVDCQTAAVDSVNVLQVCIVKTIPAVLILHL